MSALLVFKDIFWWNLDLIEYSAIKEEKKQFFILLIKKSDDHSN